MGRYLPTGGSVAGGLGKSGSRPTAPDVILPSAAPVSGDGGHEEITWVNLAKQGGGGPTLVNSQPVRTRSGSKGTSKTR